MNPFKPLRSLVLCGLALAAAAAGSSARAQDPAPPSTARLRPMVVDFLDVGQGDSILVRSPEGKVALIDAGPTRDEAARLLKAKGIESVDIAIVTHHHLDHYGGMEKVIREFKPRFFMATGSSHTTRSYLKLLEAVRDEGITSVEPTGKPRRIELGSVILTVFPQPAYSAKEENDNSIGIRLQYGGFSVVMTGDSEEGERAAWVSGSPDLLRESTVLKLAHHGSRNGTDQEWLDLIRPEIAVASVGEGNSYGHPHAEAVSLLRRNGIPLLRTDQRGTISIISNGETWNLVKPDLASRRAGRARAGGRVAASGRQSRTAARPARTAGASTGWR
ncbi:ComEC family competence protein [Aquisphaera giovannonii]|uniref:ComEC family competence protein n=1 Tax=Aquisphaera giovannonii TaxID=406548 RepID=A0A5B9W1S3_9BACT|nr:ComEC/Rec2 family competence protein [Aquisphaera giovannonii]QEH34207.1 ComEC family competence protein [Aquisphaera giovannonii]